MKSVPTIFSPNIPVHIEFLRVFCLGFPKLIRIGIAPIMTVMSVYFAIRHKGASVQKTDIVKKILVVHQLSKNFQNYRHRSGSSSFNTCNLCHFVWMNVIFLKINCIVYP